MNKEYKRCYWISVGLVVVLSVYPIYMGVVTLVQFLQNGWVDAQHYPKYVIPYTPLCVGLLLSTLLAPVFFRHCKRWALPAGSLLGIAVFLLCELGMEQIGVWEASSGVLPMQAWQYSLCVATPEVLQFIGLPLYASNNPAFKVHFYLIAIAILLASLYVIYGFSRMILDIDYRKRTPLTVQLITLVVFIGLCVLACFTAFFRNGTLFISSLSAFLMGAFFTVFGVTLGVYVGCIFYGRRPALAVALPTLAALLTAAGMYCAEYVLMGGTLYRFGFGFLFTPLGTFPLAPVDVLIVLLSGGCTLLILYGINRGAPPKRGRNRVLRSR